MFESGQVLKKNAATGSHKWGCSIILYGNCMPSIHAYTKDAWLLFEE